MPYLRFAVDVTAPREQVVERLQGIVRPPRKFLETLKRDLWLTRAKADDPLFWGEVKPDSFRVRHDIRYRNSFLPTIYGELHPAPTGTHVSLRMSLHPFVAAFMILWLSAVGFAALISASKAGGEYAFLFPADMFALGITIVCGGFFPEAQKARRILIDTMLHGA